MTQATVMVAESWHPMATALVKTLRMQGLESEPVQYFEKDKNGRLFCKPWNGELKPVPESIRFALVDAMIDQPLTGEQVIPELNKLGITCLGIAAMENHNLAMKAAGAQSFMCKAFLLALVYTGALRIDNLENVTEEVRKDLEVQGKKCRGDKVLKMKLDALLQETK
jgi:hypothetical protein